MADRVLEEAIRQHLELKRSRGADPDEVARLEHEALGPVQPAAPDPETDPEPGAAGDPALVGAEDPALGAPASGAGAPDPGETQAFDPLLEEPAAASDPVPDPEAPGLSAEEARVEASRPSASPPTEMGQPRVPPGAEAPPEDWLAEGEEPAPPAAPEPDPDVLERTPEFLEETPEHDRLWFEQKPPRDFDFDG